MADSTGPNRDPFSDDALAGAYRATRKPGGEHLSADQWERLACDELRGPDRERALAHIEACSECTAVHRGVLYLRSEATALEAGSAAPARRGGRSRWTLAAGLAAAAALVAAVVINQPGRTALRDDDALRSGDTRNAITVVTPAANSVLTGRRFEWEPIATAVLYEIRVHTADGGRVWSARLKGTSAELPADVTLSSGTYYWQVAALRDEAPIAASPMLSFRVN